MYLRAEATTSDEVIPIVDGFEGCYERSRMSMHGGPGTSGLMRGGSFCGHASQVVDFRDERFTAGPSVLSARLYSIEGSPPVLTC